MEEIDWLKVLGWNKDQLDDLRFCGYAYIRQGKYDIALPIFEALTAFNDDDAYDFQTLGGLYLQLSQPAKALKCFEKALQLEGDHAPTLLNLSKTFLILGRKEEGLRLAQLLSNDAHVVISNTAKALLLAYG